MAGCYALSRMLNEEFVFSWEYDDSCPGEFDEIFESSIAGFPVQSSHHNLLSSTSRIYIHAESSPTACGCTPEAIFNRYLEGGFSQSIFYSFVDEFYKNLLPEKKIAQRVNDFWSRHQLETKNVIGVHIRRTDMLDHIKSRSLEPVSDDNLWRAIDSKLNNDASINIFAAADNPLSISEIKLRYGDKVLSNEVVWNLDLEKAANDSKKQARLTSIQDSIFDLYALSKCDVIIGTKNSSFSSFASLWGSVPLVKE